MGALAVGLLVLVALGLKRSSSTASDAPKASDAQQQPVQPPVEGAPGSQLPQQIVGGATTAIGAVGAVVGALKGAGLFTGAGATAATTTTTTTVVGGGGGTTVGTGIGGAALASQLGVAAVIIAAELIITWAFVTLNQGAAAFQAWIGSSPLRRLDGLWFIDEATFVRNCVDPELAPIDPKTGKPAVPSEPRLFTSREPVQYIDGYNVSITVVRDLQLPAAETLRLYRAARYMAIRRLAAYNAVEFWFFENAYVGKKAVDVGAALLGAPAFSSDGMRNSRGVHPDLFWEHVNQVLAVEPWADELGARTACDYAGLEAAARSLFVPNFDLAVQNAEFLGRVKALTDCAITGWPWLGWPGDENFNRLLMGYAKLGGVPGKGALPGIWTVDSYWVDGGNRWVAVDPVTKFGIDLQQSRANHGAKVYSPELLKTGSTRLPQPSQAQPATVSTAPATLARVARDEVVLAPGLRRLA